MTFRELRPLLRRYFRETAQGRYEPKEGYLLTLRAGAVVSVSVSGRAATVGLATKPSESSRLSPLGQFSSADFRVYRRVAGAEGGETYLPEV